MASGNDIRAAQESYNGFVGIVKWGTILSIIAVTFVVGLIAS